MRFFDHCDYSLRAQVTRLRQDQFRHFKALLRKPQVMGSEIRLQFLSPRESIFLARLVLRFIQSAAARGSSRLWFHGVYLSNLPAEAQLRWNNQRLWIESSAMPSFPGPWSRDR